MRIEPSELSAAGILLERVMGRVFRVPIDLRRLQLFLPAVENADVVLGEIVRLILHFRDQVLLHDRGRHRPIRIEVDLHDLAVDFRRRTVRLADHGGVARHGDAILDRLDARGRDIRQHITRAEIASQRTQARDVDLELCEPRRRRHVERGERLGADDAVDRDAMAGLEAPHRAFDVGIVHIVADRVRIDVAGGGQARAQRRHARMAVAEPQHADRRNLRPAATVDDRGIALDGLLGGLRGRGRDGRHRCFRHMDGAGRLVEVLPERPALGVADQRIQSRILGKGRARRQSGGGERGRAG